MTQPLTPTQAEVDLAQRALISNTPACACRDCVNYLAHVLARHAQAARLEGAKIVSEAMSEAIGSGYPSLANKRDQCEHGKFSWEDCINCYDDHLEAALSKALDPLSIAEKGV